MNLSSEQVEKLTDMLGTPKIVWSRCGLFFAPERAPEMDLLVDAGALHVEETLEPWGPTVTYSVTATMRNILAVSILRGGSHSASAARPS